MKRRVVALMGFVAGAFAGSVLLRRQFGKRRDRIELYFDDGSMITYPEGAPEAVSLLEAAYEALRAARS
jgi:hypothetical protein